MSQLTLNLPDDVARALADASRQSRRGEEEVALDLLKRALAVQRFRSIRESLLETLGDDAPQDDDDVLRQIS
jgi:hypothetical protein